MEMVGEETLVFEAPWSSESHDVIEVAGRGFEEPQMQQIAETIENLNALLTKIRDIPETSDEFKAASKKYFGDNDPAVVKANLMKLLSARKITFWNTEAEFGDREPLTIPEAEGDDDPLLVYAGALPLQIHKNFACPSDNVLVYINADFDYFGSDPSFIAGGVLHEMTHSIFGTVDHAYQENTLGLVTGEYESLLGAEAAGSLSEQALANADSYALFSLELFHNT